MPTEAVQAVCGTVQAVVFLLVAGAVVSWVAWLVYLDNRPAGACPCEEEEGDE